MNSGRETTGRVKTRNTRMVIPSLVRAAPAPIRKGLGSDQTYAGMGRAIRISGAAKMAITMCCAMCMVKRSPE